jgi:copper(I)-binding protein
MSTPRFLRWLVVTLSVIGSSISFAAPPLQVENPWIPEAPPVSSVLAGYVTLVNPSDETVTIEAVSSEVFDRVEIHRTVMQQGMARMEPQDTLTIPAHDRVQLKPGGLHLMLIKPKQALKNGDQVDLSLKLSSGDIITTRFVVKRSTADADAHQHHHH